MFFRKKVDFEKECTHLAKKILTHLPLSGTSVGIRHDIVTLYLHPGESIWEALPLQKNLYVFERTFRSLCSVGKDYLKEKQDILKKLHPSIESRKGLYFHLTQVAFGSHAEKTNAIFCAIQQELKIDPTHCFFRYSNLDVSKSLDRLHLSLREFIEKTEKSIEQKIIDHYVALRNF